MTDDDGRKPPRRVALIVAGCAAWCAGVAAGLEAQLPWWMSVVAASTCAGAAIACAVFRGTRAMAVAAGDRRSVDGAHEPALLRPIAVSAT